MDSPVSSYNHLYFQYLIPAFSPPGETLTAPCSKVDFFSLPGVSCAATMNKGYFFAIGCYSIWGLLPIYWVWLKQVPSLQILAHRMAWSLVFFVLVLAWKQDLRWLKRYENIKPHLATFCLSALVISVNWLTYIYGVTHERIIETSLGYFINPLVTILLGVILLKESLTKVQGVALGLAFIGVLYLTVEYGKFPFIAMTLALTFSGYGLLKKKTKMGPLRGMTLETALMVIPASAFLFFLEQQGTGVFGHVTPKIDLLLILAGSATGLPLVLFAVAAKHLPLSHLGILQYLGPTLQFLIGVFIYNEPFNQERLIGFAFVWLALILFSAEFLLQKNRSRLTLSRTLRGAKGQNEIASLRSR